MLIFKTILFPGDSIADTLHKEEYICAMGYGYPGYVTGRLGLEDPGKYCFITRGVGGNRITDVYARIKQDIINLKPDVMSLLFGINDVWHECLNQDGVSTTKFEMIYRLLLDEMLSELPDTEIILLEPFVLKGEGTEANYAEFRTGVEEKATVVRKLAKDLTMRRLRIPLLVSW